jgi:chromosome segregation ATPase
MSRAVVPVVCLLTSLALGTGAWSQSLGDVAARERERRKANKLPAKVYTEDELKNHGAPANAPAEDTSSEPAPSASPSPASTAASEKSPDEQRAEELKSWRAELDKTNADVARLSEEVSRLEAEVGDLRGLQFGTRRTQALQELERTRGELAAARQKADDMLEAGRRRGFRAL